MSISEQIVVVGGGISGLTAAFRLQQAGCSVRVLEAGADVGGRMTTLALDDYRIDLAVTLLPSSYRQVLKLIDDVGVSDQIIATSDLAGVLRDGTVHRTRGSSKLDGLRTPLLSWSSKIVLMRALIDAARAGDKLSWENLSLAAEYDGESAADYARRRLNEELYAYLVTPICGAFCLAPPEQVSAVNLLFVLRHFIGQSFFNSRTGVDFLPRAIAKQLPVSLNARVDAVREVHGGVEISWLQDGVARSDRVEGCIIALPATAMAEIYQDLQPQRRELARRIDYAMAMGVHLGLRRRPEEPASVIQIPAAEHPEMAGVILEHNKAPGRAPDDKGLLTLLWRSSWARPRWERDDRVIAEEALAVLHRRLPQLAGDVDVTHVQRWRFGPQIPHPGSHRAMREFHRVDDSQRRVQLAGDYFATASSNAAIVSAEKAARDLQRALRGTAAAQA